MMSGSVRTATDNHQTQPSFFVIFRASNSKSVAFRLLKIIPFSRILRSLSTAKKFTLNIAVVVVSNNDDDDEERKVLSSG